ncbi:DUF3488 and transglutaminase-like domain-containing protein [Yinghuangia soli]|uniref:DUF3488 and transglutaminase-like domain-containing protein n=1 Tax=Yinghuangia soli TaxID=2908204 RepID=A0AA41PVN5_9ACTN|nr:DUF3488 and transglutaminase-like domain-containing protein [Yinghuangia soli]MCF2526733.1 DUF3488 and transglutaminase-like domain-containing protein [Yinghuangia soli]
MKIPFATTASPDTTPKAAPASWEHQARAATADTAERRRAVVSLLPVAALAAIGGGAYHRVFAVRDILPAVAVSATVPVLAALVWGLLGRSGKEPRPLAGSLLIGLALWLPAVSASVYHADAYLHVLPTRDLLRRIGTDLLDAPRGLLTTVAPAPDDPGLLVLVSATVWVAAWAGAELALRSGTTVLPVLPGLLMLGVPVVLSTGAPGGNALAVTAAVGAAGLLLLSRAPGHRSPLRVLLTGVPWVLALTVLAGYAGPRLPGTDNPPDLHDQVAAPPPVRLAGINPLDRISAWLLTPDQPLFTVAGPADPDRYWRLVVLDRYDGTTWYPVSGLRPTGGRVPGTAGSIDGMTTKRAVQQVTLDRLDGVWLPAADRPASVAAADDVELAVDPASGTVATGSALQPGLRYRVESQVPVYDPDRLKYLPTVDDPAHVALPELDAAAEPIPMVADFRTIAMEATAGSSAPYQQALRLADWLRANHRYDITAVPGHSYRNLRFFLESSKEGTSEQFASAFAVLGRTLGLPTRVVVGFSRGTALPDGTWRVDSGNVVAWPEVHFAGVGWVPFYPTPGEAGRSGSTKTDADTQVAAQTPPTVTPPAPDSPSRTDKDRGIAAEDRTAEGGLPAAVPPAADQPAPMWWWAAPLALLAAVGLGHTGLAFAAPRMLRRRRRRGSPEGRLFGAWRQICDRLVESGMPGGGAHTVRDTADFGLDHLPEEAGGRLLALSAVVNDVEYAGRTVTDQDADEAWQACAAIEAAARLDDKRPKRWTRIRHALSPWTVAATLRRR